MVALRSSSLRSASLRSTDRAGEDVFVFFMLNFLPPCSVINGTRSVSAILARRVVGAGEALGSQYHEAAATWPDIPQYRTLPWAATTSQTDGSGSAQAIEQACGEETCRPY